MTKTVKLTESYLKIITKLKNPKPFLWLMVDRATLDMSTIKILGKAICSYEEIKADPTNVKILNTKIDNLGRVTRDESSIHSTISVNLYAFENKNSTCVIPNSVIDNFKLITKNLVEEVT